MFSIIKTNQGKKMKKIKLKFFIFWLWKYWIVCYYDVPESVINTPTYKIFVGFVLVFKCKSPNETLRPCEVHQSKFPYAKKECSILYSDLFAPCRNVVSLLNIQDCSHENNKIPVMNFFSSVPSVGMRGYRVKPCKYLCVGRLYLCRAPYSFQDWNLNIKVVTELWVSLLNNQGSNLFRFYLYPLSI